MQQSKIFSPEQYLAGNQLELVRSGQPFFKSLVQLIDNAEKTLYFQVYIFEEDDTGRDIAEALLRARERKVEVYLTLDSYGSKNLSDEFLSRLRRSGIHFRYFSPLPKHFYAFRLGRRLHCKVMVADAREALVGGINIADKYRGTAEEAAWLDFAVRVEGPVCADLMHMCKLIHGKKSSRTPRNTKGEQDKAAGSALARVALNDWWRRRNQVSAGYRAAFRNAQQSIFIVASYFLPSRGVRTALKNASRRGVKITVLLPGKLDLPMARRATRYLYRWLSRNKIEIYEWTESVLHGKIAVVDNNWSTVGSYNLNHLSEYSSIETNVEVLDKDFAASVNNTLAGLVKQCSHVPADSFNNRGLINKFLDWISYILGRWMMLLLFFLIARGHRYKNIQ